MGIYTIYLLCNLHSQLSFFENIFLHLSYREIYILHNKQYHFILRITDISYSYHEIFGEKINNDRTFDSGYGVIYSWYDIYPIDIKL